MLEKHVSSTRSNLPDYAGIDDRSSPVSMTASITQRLQTDNTRQISPPTPPRGAGSKKTSPKTPPKKSSVAEGPSARAKHVNDSDDKTDSLKIDEFVRVNAEIHGTEFRPSKKDLRNFNTLIKMYPPEKLREKMELLKQVILSAYITNDKYLLRKPFSPTTLLNEDAILSPKVVSGLRGEKFIEEVDVNEFFGDDD